MPFFLPIGTGTKQPRVALKFYDLIDKGPYFQNNIIERKKNPKVKVESSIEPPTAKSYFSASGWFFFYSGSACIYMPASNFIQSKSTGNHSTRYMIKLISGGMRGSSAPDELYYIELKRVNITIKIILLSTHID